MSQLIYRSPYSKESDQVVIAFEGTADQTLVATLDYLSKAADESRKRIQAMEEAPAACKAMAAKTDLAEFPNRYTIAPRREGGYAMWISDGPDRYDLID